MTRILIIALAVLAGAAIGLALARYRRRMAKGGGESAQAETVLVEEGSAGDFMRRMVLPVAGAVLVLALGLFLLVDNNRAPVDAEYSPAVIDGNTIKPGTFGDR